MLALLRPFKKGVSPSHYSMKLFSTGFPGRMKSSSTPLWYAHSSSTREVNSVLLFPNVEGRIADAHLPAHIRDRRTAIDLPQRVSNLLVGEPRSLHRPLSLGPRGRFVEDLRSHFSPALNRPQNRDSGQANMSRLTGSTVTVTGTSTCSVIPTAETLASIQTKGSD